MVVPTTSQNKLFKRKMICHNPMMFLLGVLMVEARLQQTFRIFLINSTSGPQVHGQRLLLLILLFHGIPNSALGPFLG